MSDNKPKTTIADILARKKQQQFNQQAKFDPKNVKGKINTKGFGGPNVMRKTGRGS